MPVPSNVARKLREVLGPEAGEDLVTWMGETAAVRADLAELRHEMQVSVARMEANLTAQIERSKADLMKWSFVFWCGAVAAIAALAGVLRS